MPYIASLLFCWDCRVSWPVRVSAVTLYVCSTIWHLWCASCVLIVFRCCRCCTRVCRIVAGQRQGLRSLPVLDSSASFSSCFLICRVSSCLSITADATGHIVRARFVDCVGLAPTKSQPSKWAIGFFRFKYVMCVGFCWFEEAIVRFGSLDYV